MSVLETINPHSVDETAARVAYSMPSANHAQATVKNILKTLMSSHDLNIRQAEKATGQILRIIRFKYRDMPLFESFIAMRSTPEFNEIITKIRR